MKFKNPASILLKLLILKVLWFIAAPFRQSKPHPNSQTVECGVMRKNKGVRGNQVQIRFYYNNKSLFFEFKFLR